MASGRLMAASNLTMLMFGAVQVLPAICLDAIGRELGLDLEQRGRLLALRMAALTVSLLVVGHFGDRPGRRHALFWGLIVITVAQAMGACASGYAQLLWSTIIAGVGYGIVEALVNPLVAQLRPRDSARALNIVNGVFSLGLVVSALTAGELLQAGHSWRLAFWLWAAPPLVCAILYLTPRYPAPAGPVAGADSPLGLGAFLTRPLFWILMLAMVLAGGCEAGMTTWAPNFVTEVLKASARGGAWATIVYGVMMAVGRFASGLLATRLTPLRLMLGSAVLCGAVTVGLAFVPVLWGAWLLFGLGGLFVACFWPTLLAVASDSIATGSTSLFSLLSAAGVSGCVIVPWAIGALGDAVDLRVGMLVLPATMALLLMLLTLSRRFATMGVHRPTKR